LKKSKSEIREKIEFTKKLQQQRIRTTTKQTLKTTNLAIIFFYSDKMPFDQKRINGPESSFPFKQFIAVDKAAAAIPTQSTGRTDGRELNENRNIGKL
jgi:hypothetical protein